MVTLTRHIMRSILFVFFLSLLPLLAGNPNAAARHVRSFDQSMKEWVAQVQAAKNGDAQARIWTQRPKPEVAGRRIWAEIRNNLSEGWTIEYAAWLLENSPEVLAPKQNARQVPGAIRIRKAIEKFHVKSARVAPYCIAVTHFPDPGVLKVLESIEQENPDKRVQGAAALGQAILLRKLDQGGEGGIVPKRQAKMRKAIIDGHDLIVGKRKLSDIAQAEIDQFRLSIGAEAPDLRGIDIATKPFALQDYRGKVVVLFFWHTWMKEAGRTLEIMRKLHQNLQGKNAVIIGVSADHAKTLRKMTADGDAPWRNFFDNDRKLASQYHIDRWPRIYVLDHNGKIRHKGSPGAFVELAVEALLDGKK